MKQLLFLISMTFIAMNSFSQAPTVTLTNNSILCTLNVTLYCGNDIGCDVACVAGPICMTPSSTATVPSCSNDCHEWGYIKVCPVTACSGGPCGPDYCAEASYNGCLGLPNNVTVAFPGCPCGSLNVIWTSPSDVIIN